MRGRKRKPSINFMNIRIFFFLVWTLILTNCGNAIFQKNFKIVNKPISSITDEKNLDTTLQTGWYYVIDFDNGYKRQIKNSQVYYFIDPSPIVLSKNFKTLKIYNNQQGIPEMLMTLDEKGTEAWSVATEKFIGKRLAFILDDKLLEADYVNSQITGGITALISGDYTKDELEKIKTVIESEK